jgi:hypothetical protein
MLIESADNEWDHAICRTGVLIARVRNDVGAPWVVRHPSGVVSWAPQQVELLGVVSVDNASVVDVVRP